MENEVENGSSPLNDAPQARAAVFVNVHLISDSTGETLNAVMRAISGRFDHMRGVEHFYYLVRSQRHLHRVLQEIEDYPGIVLFTIFNNELRRELMARCVYLAIPCFSVLDGIIELFSGYLGQEQNRRIGHIRVNEPDYYRRIEAMNYVLSHDDGQGGLELNEAEVILVGVSRTSKTPTSVYLANRGIKTANVPLVPGAGNERLLNGLSKPLIVGLKINPERLVQIRRNRLLSLKEDKDTAYVDDQAVRDEVIESIRLFERNQWPVIDVTRRSVEETAAAILNMLAERNKNS